jgi:hypothetical protein
LLCKIGMISFANETVAVEAPPRHGEALAPDEDPAPAVTPMAVPAAPLLAPDAAPLLAPELTMAIVPELVPPPVADNERPVRSPHPAMASSVNERRDHHRI